MRQPHDEPFELLGIHLNPGWQWPVFGQLQVLLHPRLPPIALWSHLHDIAHADRSRRHIHELAVERDGPVLHQVTAFVAGRGKAHPEHGVIQALLQLLQQHLPGHALGFMGALKVAFELALQHPVDALGFLFLAQLHPVVGQLHADLAMLARRIGALLQRTLDGIALQPFEEEFHPFPTAQPTRRTHVATHEFTLLQLVDFGFRISDFGFFLFPIRNPQSTFRTPSDSPSFRGTAPVVRNRRHVLDRSDRQPGLLE